jgi:hypothetical protein
MNSVTKVSVYRAIVGKVKSMDKTYIHEGVNDERLAQNGIFCSNSSFAQHNTLPGSTGYDLRVPGLPIFLNFDEAVFWINEKQYEIAPAIVESEVPVNYLFDNNRKVKLVKNYWDKVFGYEPTRHEVENHLIGGQKLRGEHFLQGQNGSELTEILRSDEIIYRPNNMSDGRVFVADGFSIVKLIHK